MIRNFTLVIQTEENRKIKIEARGKSMDEVFFRYNREDQGIRVIEMKEVK